MTLKQVAIYRSRMNGNSVEEEYERLKLRGMVKNANLFKLTSYEKYLWQKENNKMKGGTIHKIEEEVKNNER